MRFPVAARAGFGNVRDDPDLITPKLPALHFYQLVDAGAEAAARELRRARPPGAARRCSTARPAARRCHVPPLFTEPGLEHAHRRGDRHRRLPGEPLARTGRYRTTPLAGLFTRQKGGFYHDGRFANLRAVVDHYDQAFSLGLDEEQSWLWSRYLESL